MTAWSMGEAAQKCGLSPHTLRWYERIGLLGHIARGADGHRWFSQADMDWLLLLTKLRATGMPVRDMQRYARLVRSGAGEPQRLELLRRHRELVVQALAEQQECLRLLDRKISSYQVRIRAWDQEPADHDKAAGHQAPGHQAPGHQAAGHQTTGHQEARLKAAGQNQEDQ